MRKVVKLRGRFCLRSVPCFFWFIPRLVGSNKIQSDAQDFRLSKKGQTADQATKEDTFKIIASLYPELAANLTGDKPWKDGYWKHLLAAVALGVCCWQNLAEKEKTNKA